MTFYFRKDILKGINVALQHICNRLWISHTDLFPHFRGRRGNTCNVLKTAGSYLFHGFSRWIRVFYQIYKAGSNQMRQMADGGNYSIMFLIIQYQGDRPHSLRNGDNAFDIFGVFRGNIAIFTAILVKTFWRCNNIISIFKEMVSCIFIACFFRTCHGMPAYKTVCKSLTQDLFVDVGLGAANIRDQSPRF